MDRELLLRARAGDMEAFESIVLAKSELLYRTAVAILANEADARDSVQETLVKAWRNLPQLRDVERFDAWLGRALINECRDSLRRRKRIREVAPDVAPERSSASDSNGGQPSELLTAFARLPVDQRSLLVLHHLHGYGVSEIGAWLGIPTGTVKWRLSRARSALRRELERDR
jgi:RNA polymerase sigma-70 factor, ECF subfamily